MNRMNRLNSGFAAKIDDMLEFRRAHGYKDEPHISNLRRFDRHCTELFPEVSELTSEIVLSWIDKETELGGSLISKATAIRHLGKYLNALGEFAYVLPERVASHRHSFSPYIFTDSEMTVLFAAIDALPPDNREPYLPEIAPTMFRLIYTCGLRPNECRELHKDNIDLDTGEILITNTKRNKERIVVMSDDMLDLARDYDFKRKMFGGNSIYFFPARNGVPFNAERILAVLNKAWTMAMCTPQNPSPQRIRVYDLRHRFASACLNRWLDNGENLMAMLPYLREYMGHGSINETAYYIHILPENLVKTAAIDWEVFNKMFPVPRGWTHE